MNKNNLTYTEHISLSMTQQKYNIRKGTMSIRPLKFTMNHVFKCIVNIFQFMHKLKSKTCFFVYFCFLFFFINCKFLQEWNRIWKKGHTEIHGDDKELQRNIHAAFYNILSSLPQKQNVHNPFIGLSPGKQYICCESLLYHSAQNILVNTFVLFQQQRHRGKHNVDSKTILIFTNFTLLDTN